MFMLKKNVEEVKSKEFLKIDFSINICNLSISYLVFLFESSFMVILINFDIWLK